MKKDNNLNNISHHMMKDNSNHINLSMMKENNHNSISKVNMKISSNNQHINQHMKIKSIITKDTATTNKIATWAAIDNNKIWEDIGILHKHKILNPVSNHITNINHNKNNILNHIIAKVISNHHGEIRKSHPGEMWDLLQTNNQIEKILNRVRHQFK